MIKGVNKQVVEINETGNEFFEKAIFFVRPEYSAAGEGKLRDRAQRVLNKTPAPPSSAVLTKKEKFPTILKLLAAAAAGAIITAVIAAVL